MKLESDLYSARRSTVSLQLVTPVYGPPGVDVVKLDGGSAEHVVSGQRVSLKYGNEALAVAIDLESQDISPHRRLVLVFGNFGLQGARPDLDLTIRVHFAEDLSVDRQPS